MVAGLQVAGLRRHESPETAALGSPAGRATASWVCCPAAMGFVEVMPVEVDVGEDLAG